MKLENNLNSATTWDIYEERFVADQAITTGSNYMIGNGYLGYRGTFADDRAAEYVACVVTDTYDNADGVWKELVTAPNGLYTELAVDGRSVLWRDAGWGEYRRSLDFRYGRWSARADWDTEGLEVEETRFASYDDLHLLAARTRLTASRRVALTIRTGIDGIVWSLNGDHFAEKSQSVDGSQLQAYRVTGEHGYEVVVREHAVLALADGAEIPSVRIDDTEGSVFRVFEIDLDAGETVYLTKYVSVYSTNDIRDGDNPQTRIGSTPGVDPDRPTRADVELSARTSIERAVSAGWDDVQSAHRERWDARWSDMDIAIQGDETAQTLLRYNLYHNIIATPAHADHLPIGARGLSCQAYQGAAFWDQEVFNLPMFLFTAPEVARNILVYRYKTLDGARKKARDLGYRGAFYAWVSGDSGEEICPSYFFKDVISGRRIRNHFNDWQIHVSPDIAYTIWKYVTVTHDWDYLERYGAEIVFEIARFLVSRSHYRKDRERYDIIRVLGPDEYHENVDNNFFTNFQVRFASRYAADVYDRMRKHAPERLVAVSEAIGLEEREPRDWRELADGVYVRDADPETRLIEQFDGFFQLEDTTPEEIKGRLIDASEYWGWPNGIAVETQVSKQADVAQLFMLHPTAHDTAVMKANWEYYEPRTQHGSSLSPAVYAIVAAWVGRMEEAERYFFKSCTVDLYNTNKAVSGGTFIGGIHTAACGVSWQIVVSGFAGLYLTEKGFGFRPHLPAGWDRLSFVLKRWGCRIAVAIEADPDGRGARLKIVADDANPGALEIETGSDRRSVEPGAAVELQS